MIHRVYSTVASSSFRSESLGWTVTCHATSIRSLMGAAYRPKLESQLRLGGTQGHGSARAQVPLKGHGHLPVGHRGPPARDPGPDQHRPHRGPGGVRASAAATRRAYQCPIR
jgi:hypothetical protein